MCNACKEAYWRLGADSSLNPEPSEIARAQYRRHVAAAESPAESCDNLSLDSVRGVADTLGVGIDEARRLLAHNRPEDWQQ